MPCKTKYQVCNVMCKQHTSASALSLNPHIALFASLPLLAAPKGANLRILKAAKYFPASRPHTHSL